MRIFLSLLLATGAAIGIGGGVARLHHGGRHHRQHMMERVAETCVEAARNLDRRERRADPAPAPVFVPYPYALPPLGYPPPAHHGPGGQHGPVGHPSGSDQDAREPRRESPAPGE